MGNDLGGVAKDLKNRWLNLVLVDMQRSSCTITDAFARIVATHDRDVLAFDRLAEQLPAVAPETAALLRGWIQAVRHNVYGFALWESTAERYQEYKAIAGRHALLAPVMVQRTRLARRTLARASTVVA